MAVLRPVLRIRIEKMRVRMQIQEKISMRMRTHALTELWLASNSKRNLKGQSTEILLPFLTSMDSPRPDFQKF